MGGPDLEEIMEASILVQTTARVPEPLSSGTKEKQPTYQS